MKITPIPGYEKYYGATEDGRIFSFNYKKTGKVGELAQSELTDKRRKSRTKYKRVKAYFINKNTPTAVHRLIALTFIPNPNNYPLVNHIDGNKGNNHARNLEWCTHKQNVVHAENNGLSIHAAGEKHHASKLTEKQAAEIKKELNKRKYRGQLPELAKKYNVSIHCIFDIRRNKSWTHL